MLTLFALSDFFQGLLGPWVGHRLGPLRLGLINICRGVAEKFILQFQEEGYFRKSLKIDEPITLADFYFPSAFKRAEKKIYRKFHSLTPFCSIFCKTGLFPGNKNIRHLWMRIVLQNECTSTEKKT